MPSTHSLDGAKLKLGRAYAHFEVISEICERFKHGECEIVPEIDRDDLNLGVLRVRLRPQPPVDLPVIIGDCLFNVRSALDHIAWQLVLPKNPTPGNKLIFPISKDRKAFDKAVADNGLKDAPVNAVAVIEGLQPYHTGETHPLALLSKLHNVDKHRQLNVLAAVARDTELAWSPSIYDGGIEAQFISIFGNDELRDGATMPFGLRLDHPDYPGIRDRFTKMKVQGYAALFVAFEDRALLDPAMLAIEERYEFEALLEPSRVDWVLQEILQFVGDTVFPVLQPFFN